MPEIRPEPLDIHDPGSPDQLIADMREAAAALNADAGTADWRRKYTLKEIVIQADWLRTTALVILAQEGKL